MVPVSVEQGKSHQGAVGKTYFLQRSLLRPESAIKRTARPLVPSAKSRQAKSAPQGEICPGWSRSAHWSCLKAPPAGSTAAPKLWFLLTGSPVRLEVLFLDTWGWALIVIIMYPLNCSCHVFPTCNVGSCSSQLGCVLPTIFRIPLGSHVVKLSKANILGGLEVSSDVWTYPIRTYSNLM